MRHYMTIASLSYFFSIGGYERPRMTIAAHRYQARRTAGEL